ncbi:MAG: hypothetical protein WD266_01045 [Balneolales bacterium]
MEAPILLIMGIFVAILVVAGILYSISEFTKMKDPGEEDKDSE